MDVFYNKIKVIGMKKLNNKGFTLVEMLAVLVILIAIMGVSIPSISSSLEKTKEQERMSKEEGLQIQAEVFVTDYKLAVYQTLSDEGVDSCAVLVSQLKEMGYVALDELKNDDGTSLGGCVIFTRPGIYTYQDSQGSCSQKCVS